MGLFSKKDIIREAPEGFEEYDVDNEFEFLAEDVFPVGFGKKARKHVVTGTILSGTVREGDILLFNDSIKVTVEGIESGRTRVESAGSTVKIGYVGLLISGLPDGVNLKEGMKAVKLIID